MLIQLIPSTTHGLNYAILLLITINLLPVTMCYSLRPIWLTKSSSSLQSSPTSPSSDYIDNQRLLDSINDLTSLSDSEFDSIDELNSFNANNNLISNKLNDHNDAATNSNNNNLNQFKSSSPLTIPNVNDNQLIEPWIESEILSKSIGNKNIGNGGGGRHMLIDQKMTRRGGNGVVVGVGGGGVGNGNESEIKEDKKRSESRVKKALSLFAHWKPTSTYKQHLDDAYSSELVSAVSRGHGRPMGHSLRWG